MEWDNLQNFSSNVVFGILLLTTIIYWFSLIVVKNSFVYNIGKFGSIIANGLLFLILGSRWVVAGYFPLSNLYESLLFLT